MKKTRKNAPHTLVLLSLVVVLFFIGKALAMLGDTQHTIVKANFVRPVSTGELFVLSDSHRLNVLYIETDMTKDGSHLHEYFRVFDEATLQELDITFQDIDTDLLSANVSKTTLRDVIKKKNLTENDIRHVENAIDNLVKNLYTESGPEILTVYFSGKNKNIISFIKNPNIAAIEMLAGEWEIPQL